ncbi:hypothetical protein ACFX13_040957 [Malus domestica]
MVILNNDMQLGINLTYLIRWGGGKDEKHETTEKALFSYGGVYGSYPPQGYGYPPQAHHAFPSSGGYPPPAYPSYVGYPPTSYPPTGYPVHGAAGMGMGGMLSRGAVAAVPAYEADHLVYEGGGNHNYGAYHGYGGCRGYGGAPGYIGKPFEG